MRVAQSICPDMRNGHISLASPFPHNLYRIVLAVLFGRRDLNKGNPSALENLM